MNEKIMALIRTTSRTGFSERVLGIAGTDYDFVAVSLSAVRGLHYEPYHSFTLKVEVHQHYPSRKQEREFCDVKLGSDVAMNTELLCNMLEQACEEMGISPSDLR